MLPPSLELEDLPVSRCSRFSQEFTEEKYFRQGLEGKNTNWVDGENEGGCGTLY